jgi:hypothetical protein
MNKYCLFVAAMCCLGVAQAQEDPKDSCDGIVDLYADGDLDGALEEARWCVEALEQVKQAKEGDLFAADIAGWKRQSIEQNKALGVALTEATYTKGDKTITVSLMGGAGGGDMGFLGGLAQMGMMSGGNKIRVGKHTGVATSEGGTSTVTVSLDTGGTLSFASSNTEMNVVVDFAKAFPVAEIDKSRG